MGSRESRCSLRKHVIEDGNNFCDCGTVMPGKTAAKNAHVVTLMYVNAVERGIALGKEKKAGVGR